MDIAVLISLLTALVYFSFLLGSAVSARRHRRQRSSEKNDYEAELKDEKEVREKIHHTLGLAFGKGVKAYVDGKEKIDFNQLDEQTRPAAVQWYQIGVQYARGMEKGGAHWRKDDEK